MFKRSKKTENAPSPVSDGLADTKSAPPFSRQGCGDEETVIAEHITVDGTIRGEGHLKIEGSMQGRIELAKHNFRIGPQGRVQGEIHACNASISGQFKGNVKALEKVEITREAEFYGEIRAKRIAVEDGAYFKGVIELEREPHRKSAVAARAPAAIGASEAGKAPAEQPTDVKKER